MAGRSLRNGKVYAEFIEGHEPLIISGFRIRDMVRRHASGPQEEDDGASDNEDHEIDDADLSFPHIHLIPTSSATPPPPAPKISGTALLRAARQRWEVKKSDPTPPSLPANLSKKEKKRQRLRGNRSVKREVLGEVSGASKIPKAVALKRMHESSPVPVPFSFSLHPGVASTGWMGVREPNVDFEPEQRAYSFEEARELPGMRVYEWDEKQGPLVDEDHYVIGVFAAHPRDADWDQEVAQKAANLMEEAGDGIYDHVFSGVYYGTRKTERSGRQKVPPRGTYRARAFGNSMGGGQPFPKPFYQNVLNTVILAGLLAQTPFQRIAGFTNSIFRAYAPELHDYYYSTMEKLHNWNTTLKRNFVPHLSVFAAATFNFDRQTVTFPHLDYANLAWGWCSITALGDFDPDKGGHLILWDLKLIIRFPPGYTILIPSALIRHSNTSIQPHEKRFSFTQYTAAGIFRFVDNGFRSDVSVEASKMTDAEQAERVEKRKKRWTEGLAMYRQWPNASN